MRDIIPGIVDQEEKKLRRSRICFFPLDVNIPNYTSAMVTRAEIIESLSSLST